jgi:hypothetical protein
MNRKTSLLSNKARLPSVGALSPLMDSETYRIFTGSYPPPFFLASPRILRRRGLLTVKSEIIITVVFPNFIGIEYKDCILSVS